MPDHEKVHDEKLEALLKHLEEGTKAVFQSDNYKAMLTAMSKFHTYSLNNQILIAMQRPTATLVAGYRAWQTKFNRNVKKGEKGIQIIGYTPKTITTTRQKQNENGAPVLGNDGQPIMEKVKKQIPTFKVMYVFDVDQTEGEPLPTIGVDELHGDVRRFDAIQNALLKLSPVPVAFEAFPGNAKGMMDFTSNQITVQPDMSQVQTIKTLIHEIAHAQMHGGKEKLSRTTKEVEAESVAYVVCQHLGIDSSDYSFAYVAGWSGGQELSVLQASLNRIREQAMINIQALDKALAQLPEQRREAEQTLPDDTSNSLSAEHKLASFSDRLSDAAQRAADTNARRMMAAKGPLVQHAEIRRS